MALKVRHCPRCSAACELRGIASIAAQAGPLKLAFAGLPAFECPRQHRVPVHRDFMLWLIQEIRAREPQIAAGKEQGMLVFKKYLCGGCGKPLGGKPERSQASAFELKYGELAPFRLELEMPLYRCASCGREQIRSGRELQRLVPGAIVGINDAAGFPHSG